MLLNFIKQVLSFIALRMASPSSEIFFPVLINLNERRTYGIGRKTVIGPNCWMGRRFCIGNFSGIGDNASIGNEVSIGSYCSIGSSVSIITEDHPLGYPSTSNRVIPIEKYRKIAKVHPVAIGNDVWIGNNAIILKGVRIGDGAIIGAGAVVTKDVAPYSIAAGVPAKEIKKRFSREKIKKLLQMRWWDWPEKKVEENQKFFTTKL